MSTETGTSLRVSRIIKAAPETVFLAWTEPDQMNQWSAPEGMSIAAEVDLEVGGGYRIRMTSPEGQARIAAFRVYGKVLFHAQSEN